MACVHACLECMNPLATVPILHAPSLAPYFQLFSPSLIFLCLFCSKIKIARELSLYLFLSLPVHFILILLYCSHQTSTQDLESTLCKIIAIKVFFNGENFSHLRGFRLCLLFSFRSQFSHYSLQQCNVNYC